MSISLRARDIKSLAVLKGRDVPAEVALAPLPAPVPIAGVRVDKPKSGTFVGGQRLVVVQRPPPGTRVDPASLAPLVVHENLVTPVAVVEGAALVTDYVFGEHLHTFLARGAAEFEPLPLAVEVAILLDVLAGLSAVHRAGRVHRQLDPRNVFVDLGGVAKVNQLPAIPRVPAEHPLLRYLPPEVLLGDDATDPKVDIYAVGVFLWEALAGVPLLTESSPNAILVRHLSGKIGAPKLRAEVAWATDLAALSQRAIATDPQGRPATPEIFAAELTEGAKGQLATHADVAAWLERRAGEALARRRTQFLGAKATTEKVAKGAFFPRPGAAGATKEPAGVPKQESSASVPKLPVATSKVEIGASASRLLAPKPSPPAAEAASAAPDKPQPTPEDIFQVTTRPILESTGVRASEEEIDADALFGEEDVVVKSAPPKVAAPLKAPSPQAPHLPKVLIASETSVAEHKSAAQLVVSPPAFTPPTPAAAPAPPLVVSPPAFTPPTPAAAPAPPPVVSPPAFTPPTPAAAPAPPPVVSPPAFTPPAVALAELPEAVAASPPPAQSRLENEIPSETGAPFAVDVARLGARAPQGLRSSESLDEEPPRQKRPVLIWAVAGLVVLLGVGLGLSKLLGGSESEKRVEKKDNASISDRSGELATKANSKSEPNPKRETKRDERADPPAAASASKLAGAEPTSMIGSSPSSLKDSPGAAGTALAPSGVATADPLRAAGSPSRLDPSKPPDVATPAPSASKKPKTTYDPLGI